MDHISLPWKHRKRTSCYPPDEAVSVGSVFPHVAELREPPLPIISFDSGFFLSG